LPILLSLVKFRNIEQFRDKHRGDVGGGDKIWHLLSRTTERKPAAILIAIALVLFIVGDQMGRGLQIGDSQAGVPELRPDARYNLDAQVISSRFSLGVDAINIIAEAPSQACTEDYHAMADIDRFAWHMFNVDGVQQVITLPWVAKIINAGWNEGNLRWRVLPRDNFVLRQALQNVDTDTGLLNAGCDTMPIIIFTRDHRAETINRVVAAAKEYRRNNGIGTETLVSAGFMQGDRAFFNPKPMDELQPGEVNYRLATGNVGVMAAVNEVVESAQFPMLVLVYLAIIVLCVITFRSIMGTLCIVLPLVLVSVLAYALMTFLGIGLKVNTLPVVALGVGIGVDYGIYIFSRVSVMLKQGMPLKEAYFHALKQTGKPVIFTAFTLAIGVGTWIFSTLQFQADMGKLLAFMFFLNMVGAVLLLPALARWLLPRSMKGKAITSDAGESSDD
jgi:predicted RND superfamily exporter protein